jgi:hypothetical protein
MATGLTLEALQQTTNRKLLNGEWIVIVNEGDTPFSATGCSITTGRPGGKARPRTVTTLKAGLTIKPGERVRLITGSAGKASQGEPPAESEGLRNFHLFLKVPYLDRPGIIVRLVNRQQVELCRGVLAKPAEPTAE